MSKIDECVIDSLCWLPLSRLSVKEVTRIKEELTVRPYHFVSVAGYNKPNPPIQCFVIQAEKNRIGVPVSWGVDFVRDKKWYDAVWDTTEGHDIVPKRLPDLNHELAPDGQEDFVDGLIRESHNTGVFLAVAATGFGKSPCALYFIGAKAKTALVVVTTKTMASQWRKDIEQFLGFTQDEIGKVEEGKCDYKGKKVVVAVVHNLVQRGWEPEFYSYFGTVIWDEVDAMSSRHFFTSLSQFPARNRFGMTATPTKKDGTQKLFLSYFGSPSVVAAAKAEPCVAYVRPFNIRNPFQKEVPDAVLLDYLSKNTFRNLFIADILTDLYQRGRVIFGVSARIDQLEVIRDILVQRGVPYSEIGLYTRSYTPYGKSKRKVATESDLSAIKEGVKNGGVKIVLATYGMMKRGENMPPLNAGVDLTPSSSGIQIIGRIRRPFKNKPLAEWHTIQDNWHPILANRTVARLRDYRKANVDIRFTYGQT